MGNNVDEKELVRRWRKDWLFSLFLFSHIDFQKRLWLNNVYKDIIGSFSEDMCRYFDDLFINDNYKFQLDNGYVSIEEYNSIDDFHGLLALNNENYKTDSEIVADSNWIELTNIGLLCWTDLIHVIKDDDEIGYIKELEQLYNGNCHPAISSQSI